jgi:hypothetical protein
MKFEKSWSLGNAITLIVIMSSFIMQYGINSQEITTIKEKVVVQSSDIKSNSLKIVKLEKDYIGLEKDIESIKITNERMESKINKILNKLNIID